MTKALRLELAQYNELLDFAQFGTELDEISRKKLARGALAVEILKQPQGVGYSFVDQALILFLLKENFLDKIDVRNVQTYIRQFVSYVQSVYKDLYQAILAQEDISEDTNKRLQEVAVEFDKLFVIPADDEDMLE
jgi:F-type H+-transporting ATPase subunit alpha